MQTIPKQQRSIARLQSLNQELKLKNQQLSYLNPAKHSIFVKHYKLEVFPPQTHTLIQDMNDYQNLLETEMKKILWIIKSSPFFSSLACLFDTLSGFMFEYNRRNIEITSRIITKINHCDQQYSPLLKAYCESCSKSLQQQRIEAICEQIQVRRFNDRFKFYNVDHLNFRDFARMRRESQNIIDSELNYVDRKYDITSQCITYEQYEEVLNLLGSDLHSKNVSIQKIIEEMNSVEGKIMAERLSERNQTQSQKEELKVFQKMSVEQGLRNKVVQMLQRFHVGVYQYKKSRTVDCQTQVILKENEIIRQLQTSIKQLRKKMKHMQNQRHKKQQQLVNMIYKKNQTIAELNQEVKALVQRIEQARALDEQNSIQARQTIELLRNQLYQQSTKNSHLQTMVNFSKFQRSSISTNKKDIQDKRRQSSIKSKKRSTESRFSKNLTSSASNEVQYFEDINKDELKQSTTQQKRKIRNTVNLGRKLSVLDEPKQSTSNSQQTKQGKRNLSKYSKIEEAKQENESQNEERNQKKMSKMSRFKVIASLVSSHKNSSKLNSCQQEIESTKNTTIIAQRLNIDLPLIFQNNKQEKIEECTAQTQKEPGIYQEKNQQQIGVLRQETDNKHVAKKQILSKLFQIQQQGNRFPGFSLDMFLQFYQNVTEKNSIDTNQQYFKIDQNIPMNLSKSKPKNIKAISSNPSLHQTRRSKYLSIHQNNSSKQTLVNNSHSRNNSKLDLLQKHSKYYMQKTKKSSHFNSDQTSPSKAVSGALVLPPLSQIQLNLKQQLRNSNSISQNSLLPQKLTLVKKLKPSALSEGQIMNLFLNKQNILSYRTQICKIPISIFSAEQNQFLMMTSAKFAQLHIQNNKAYIELKNCLYFPEKIIKDANQIQISEDTNTNNQLKISLSYLVILHRKCSIKQSKKGIVCSHLKWFIQKIDFYLRKQQQSKVQLKQKEDSINTQLEVKQS